MNSNTVPRCFCHSAKQSETRMSSHTGLEFADDLRARESPPSSVPNKSRLPHPRSPCGIRLTFCRYRSTFAYLNCAALDGV